MCQNSTNTKRDIKVDWVITFFTVITYILVRYLKHQNIQDLAFAPVKILNKDTNDAFKDLIGCIPFFTGL